MQINTTAAFLTAALSVAIGLGIAFFIERKLNSRMQKKSQKILTSIAMMSFGYGLTATLNEVIGFPLQGLNIRYDKLAIYVAANMLLLPIVLLVIAKLIGLKNKEIDINIATTQNTTGVNSFKYFLMLAGAISVVYFGYVALEGSATDATYDFYERVDYKNCYSPYEEKPYSLRFAFKKETNEIFMTAEFEDNGVKKQQIQKLEDCSILDGKNWTCGGEYKYSYKTPKYMFVNGTFSYEPGKTSLKDDAMCAPKIVKR